MRKLRIIGIGSAALDFMIYNQQKNYQTELGDGSVFVVKEQVVQNFLSESVMVCCNAGGTTANVLRVLATNWDVEATFSGTIGSDNNGVLFGNFMQQYGVSVTLHTSSGKTGVVLCVMQSHMELSQKNNVFLFYPGCSHVLSYEVLFELKNKIYDMVYTDGYQLMTYHGYDLISIVASMCKQQKIKLSFALPGNDLCSRYSSRILSILKHSDFVFGNIIEYYSLFRVAQLEHVIAKLQKYKDTVFIVTLGEQGVVICYQQTVISLKGFKYDAIKTTIGAGDCFASGFLYGYFQGLPLQDCGQLGINTSIKNLGIIGVL